MWAGTSVLASEAHDCAGQGCGELKTSPAMVSLRQGLMAPGVMTWGSSCVV